MTYLIGVLTGEILSMTAWVLYRNQKQRERLMQDAKR